MRLPPPEFVLYVLGAFLVGYGLWLSVRALRARRWREPLEACPECSKAWEDKASAKCGRCGARRPVASAIRAARFWVVLGLVVSLGGLGTFVGGALVADMIRYEGDVMYAWRDQRFQFGPYLGGGMGLSLFGLFLAILAWRGDRPRGRRRCPKCWYLVDAAVGLRCSECGHEAKGERALFRPRRRWRLAVLGLAVVGVGQLGWYESRVRNHGWLSVVPTEVMILGLPWLPDEWVSGGSRFSTVEWSLVHRYTEDRMWGWQEAWFRDRSRGWLLAARSPSEMADRVELLSTPYGGCVAIGGDSGAAIRRLGERLLDTSVEAFDAGDTASAPRLLRPLSGLMDVLSAVAPDEARTFSTKVDQATPTLLRHISDASFEIGLLLAAGSGSEEVVDALADQTDPRVDGCVARQSRTYADLTLAMLVRSGNERAAARVAGLLADADNPRRYDMAPRMAWANSEVGDPAIDAALLGLLNTTDTEELFRAIDAIDRRGGPLVDAGFRAAIDALRADPALQSRVVESMQAYSYYSAHRHVPLLLELSRSGDPGTRSVALWLLCAAVAGQVEVGPAVEERIEAMFAEGVGMPDGVGFTAEGVLNDLRGRRFRRQEQREFEAGLASDEERSNPVAPAAEPDPNGGL